MSKKAARSSWRQQGMYGNRERASIIFRRITVTVVLAGMVGAVIWLIAQTFLPPQTHLMVLTGGYYEPLGGEPVEFPLEDVQALTALEQALSSSGGKGLALEVIKNPSGTSDDVLNQLADLTREVRRRDTMLLFLTAHGVVRDGQAYLKCPLYLGQSDQLVPVVDVLKQLADVPAQNKLVVLDSGREGSDPLSGVSTATFSRHLERQLDEVGDPNLWVLASNSGLERSHVSAALHKSIFGYVVAQGLMGGADANKDDQLGLFELYRYVRLNVSAWVAEETSGNATQTPRLLNAGTEMLAGAGPPVLSLAKLKKQEPNVKKDVQTAQSQSTSQVLGVLDTIRGQFGLPTGRILGQVLTPPIIPQIQNKLEKYQADKKWADSQAAEAGGGAEAEEEEVPAEDQPEAEIDYQPRIAEQLEEAWTLASLVEDQAAESLNCAPHFWRGLLEELLWCDRLAHSGAMRSVDQKTLTDQLKKLISQLETLSRDDPAPPDPNSPLWSERIRAAVPVAVVRDRIDARALRSIALAERVAATKREELAPELRAFLTVYDQILAGKQVITLPPPQAAAGSESTTAVAPQAVDAAAGLAELHTVLGQNPDWLRFYELQLFDRLERQASLDWSLKLLALGTRRDGERAAADLLVGEGWSRATIEAADRLRWEAERLIESRADAEWDKLARSHLNKARDLYRQAEEGADTVQRAVLARNRALGKVRDYVLWRRSSYGDTTVAPRRRDIEALFRSIRGLDDALAGTRLDVDHVADRLAVMLSAQAAVERGLTREALLGLVAPEYSSGDAWRMKVLAGTLLPSAQARTALHAQLDAASIALTSDLKLVVPPSATTSLSGTEMSDSTWETMWNQIELEQLAAGMASCAPADGLAVTEGVDKIAAAHVEALERAGFDTVLKLAQGSVDELAGLDGLDQQRAAALRDDARWYLIERSTERLAEFYASLLDRILAQENDDFSAADREQKLAQIRAAARDLHLLEARDVVESKDSEFNPLDTLNRAGWYDLLVWHARRFHQAVEDSVDSERRWLLASAGDCRGLAGEIRRQPPVPVLPPAADLRISIPSQLSLTSAETTQLRFEVATGADPAPTWLILQYDRELLSVEAEANPVYHEHELRAELAAAAKATDAQRGRSDFNRRFDSQLDDYPYHPDFFGLPTSLVLAANSRQSMTVNVRRSEQARGQTKLIIKAVSGNRYVRQELDVRLPGREMYRLLVDQNPEMWITTGDGMQLYPWPNRVHTFPFLIANETKVAREVTVAFYSPLRNSGVLLPQDPQDGAAARELLRRFGTLTPVTPEVKIELPASDDPLPVPFPPAEASEPPKDAAGNELPGHPLAHGLIAVITDVATRQQTLRRIEFAAQRPRRYLLAEATYSRAEELLQIRVTAANRNAVPVDGLRIKCDFQGQTAGAQIREALLAPPNYEALLSTYVPFDSQRRIKALVSVDDYPRAFVFDVLTREAVRGAQPETNLRQVRIVSPAPQAAYAAPRDSVAVEVQVDAPATSFSGERNDHVKVGLDTDLNRVFDRGEPLLQLDSDRQVKIHLAGLGPGGMMMIDTRVSDFQLQVPAVGLSDLRANVLGQLVVYGEQEVFSNPVEIVLDGSGPQIRDFDLIPDRDIVLGESVQVVVTPDDANLSGAAKVEIAFDRTRSNTLAENKPVECTTIAKVRWTAQLKAEKLTVGSHVILIQATDEVGNVGPIMPALVNILEPPSEDEVQQEKEEQVVKNRVTGRMAYGSNMLQAPTATLTGADGKKIKGIVNAQGYFSFSNVLPGDYTLDVAAKSRNRLRQAQEQVTVSNQPNTETNVRLDLR